MKVATFTGTGTDIVRSILKSMGHKLIVVKGRKEAYQVEFDRLLLLGGCDVSPFLYGQPIVYANLPDEVRDTTEWVLVRRAMTEQIPTMGICRGHQMLAVAHGGSLYQDIEASTGIIHGSDDHRLIKVDSYLRKHLPSNKVNSLHHQAIDVMPLGFDVMAKSDEGLIEAIYRPGTLGVQWHPELLYGHRNDSGWLKLFRWFIDGLQ